MVKVCHLTSVHNSDDVRIFHKECMSLAANGYEVYLVARGESREENGVHVIGMGEAPSSRVRRMTSFAGEVYRKALELDCDIYHFHDPELLPFGLKLKRHGKKVIFDSHENTAAQIEEKSFIPEAARKMVSAIYKAGESAAVRHLDAVIVPCTFDGKNIFEGSARKTVLIANYPKRSYFFDQYDGSAEKEYDLCYVGSLTYNRGIYHLVKAAGAGKHRLFLAGEFPDKDFYKQLVNMPEFEYVTYAGKIQNKEIAKMIQKCIAGADTLLDIGQYYHFDTFGIKVFEYMSVGVPALLPDSEYAEKMMAKYRFGICVKPDDPVQISEAVQYLSEHPEEAKQMGENGRRAVSEEFNWETQERKLIALYKDLEKEML